MQDPLGSARWSDRSGVERRYAQDGTGFFFGHPFDHATGRANTANFIRTGSEGHLLTVAGTGSGKSVSMIIPNLLCYRGSAFVIDPKGELSWLTAPRRRQFGQKVCIVDPWGQVNKLYGSRAGVEEEIAHFNPLSILKAGSREFVDELAYLADALIITQSTNDPYWDESARELIAGMMAYVVENPAYAPHASLGLVRKLLQKPRAVLERMIRSAAEDFPDSFAASKLGQFENPEKAADIPAIIRSARTQTGFLDSPDLQESMSFSDFSFDDLRAGGNPTTVYIVIPSERLKTHSRWLRLMVSIAIGRVQKGPLGESERAKLGIGDDVCEIDSEPTKEAVSPRFDPLIAPLSMPLNKESGEVRVPDRVRATYIADIEEWWVQQSPDVRRTVEKLHTNPADLARAKAGAYMASRYSEKPTPTAAPVVPAKLEPVRALPPELRLPGDEFADETPREAAKIAALPVLFLLDEFGTIGKLSIIATAYGLMRGAGITMWAFVQDLNQLKRDYDEWETFVGNASYLICFGLMEPFTINYVSGMMGMRTVRYKTGSEQTSTSTRIRPATFDDAFVRLFGDEPKLEEPSGTSTSKSTTDHVVTQPLCSPDRIRGAGPRGVFVIGKEDPILCWGCLYYNDADFSKWARADPRYAKA